MSALHGGGHGLCRALRSPMNHPALDVDVVGDDDDDNGEVDYVDLDGEEDCCDDEQFVYDRGDEDEGQQCEHSRCRCLRRYRCWWCYCSFSKWAWVCWKDEKWCK